MRHEFAQHHFSRRHALKLGTAAAAAAAAGPSLGFFTKAGASSAGDLGAADSLGVALLDGWNDSIFDVEEVLANGWGTSRFGAGDQRGAFNWFTPGKTAEALRLLDPSRPVNTYQLGESMFNGFPAFPSDPPRLHEMYLYVLGIDAGTDFGGIQAGTTPIGPNQVTVFEERFAENFTFQIATQIDGLGHVGVGDHFYNGFTSADLIGDTGLKALGNETMGPFATRGVILDIAGLKVAQDRSDDYFMVGDQPVLRDNYRITIDDIHHSMYRQHITTPFGAGDVPIFHTGWTHLARTDANRYLAQEPGIYLAESRYFASHACAMIASDTWGLEVLDPDVTEGWAFPCHQELFGKEGIRIGESFVTDSAIADNVYEGILIATPENVPGATCGSSAPCLLGQPGKAPR